MRPQQFQSLRTNTHEVMAIGTRISHLYEFEGPTLPCPWKFNPGFDGVVTKMETCDSGIWLHVKCDDGVMRKAHTIYVIPSGLQMSNNGSRTKIIKPAMRQLEIALCK
jgi:hypothetical protein